MTYSSPVTPSRYRRRRHVDVRRPYPPVATSSEAGKTQHVVRKVYPNKPRGRRSGELVRKVMAPFSWSSVSA